MNKKLASFAKNMTTKVGTGVLKDLLYNQIKEKYPKLKSAIEENCIFISKEQIFAHLQKQLSEKEDIIPKSLEIQGETVFVVLVVKKKLLNVNCTAAVKLQEIVLNNATQKMYFSADIKEIKGNDLISKIIMTIALPFTNNFLEKQLTSDKNTIKVIRAVEENRYIADISQVPHIRKCTMSIPLVGRSLFDFLRVGEVKTSEAGISINIYMEGIAS